MCESRERGESAIWLLEWVDKSGQRQQATTGSKARLEEIMDSLENSGLSDFKVSIAGNA